MGEPPSKDPPLKLFSSVSTSQIDSYYKQDLPVLDVADVGAIVAADPTDAALVALATLSDDLYIINEAV